MISIENLTVRLGGKEIIRNLSWNIRTGTRAAIVGDNGAGKSTLLRTIVGQYTPEKGSVTLPSGRVTGYLPQELTDQMEDSDVISFLKNKTGVHQLEKELEALHELIEEQGKDSEPSPEIMRKYEKAHTRYELMDGYTIESRAKKMLKGLGFSDSDHLRNCREFSGGWKMRLILVSILLSSPDILLLDEPTNHLDSESMEWLENWLSNFNGTMVLIAHDRRFLDKMVTETGELGPDGLYIYKGNYSSFLQEREQRIEIRERQRKKQQKEIEKDVQFIDRFRYKASKASQVQSRIRKLEKMDHFEEIQVNRKEAIIRFPEVPRSGHEVLKVENLAKKYGEQTIFRNIDFTLHRGEKIALVGINGAGKSTLSRLISKKENPTEGSVTFGHNVKCAFFSQESSANLSYDKTIWEEVNTCGDLPAQHKRNLLGAFLFQDDDILKRIEVLSGGEKSRLALLKILLQKSNFLVLDEATNHLDMKTKDIFLQALKQYEGTILTVSHDRHFLDQLVHRVVEIHRGRIRDYPGDYSYFIEKRKDLVSLEENTATLDKNNSRSVVEHKNRKRDEARRRNLIYRAKSEILRELTPLEEMISKLETTIETADLKLCEKETLSDSQKTSEIMIERSRSEEELQKLMNRWEILMEKIDEIETVN